MDGLQIAYYEGSEWVPWEHEPFTPDDLPKAVKPYSHGRVSFRYGPPFHAVKFPNGLEWDCVGGWRNAAGFGNLSPQAGVILREMEKESINPKDAIGRSKPSICSIPSTALAQQAIVHMLGSKKYGFYNWRTVPKVSCMTYLDAMERHLRKYLDGEDIDPESGVSHLAHIAACCNIVMDASTVGNLHDDRPPKAPTDLVLEELTGKLEAHYDRKPKEAS